MRVLVHSGRVGAEIGAREGLVTVIVDALRASATIASLLEHGASEVMVVETVEQALAEKARRPEVVLVGERECLRVEGCDLGNSPLTGACPLLPAPVVFTSSNCSRCCVAAGEGSLTPGPSPCGRGERGSAGLTPGPFPGGRGEPGSATSRTSGCRTGAARLFIGSTVNARAVARVAGQAARELGTDLLLVPAGYAEDETRFNLEDHLACGAIIKRLSEEFPVVRVGNDAARAAQALFLRAGERGLPRAFLRTDHGRRLVSVGCEADVRWCARLDVYRTAPALMEMRKLAAGGIGAVFALPTEGPAAGQA